MEKGTFIKQVGMIPIWPRGGPKVNEVTNLSKNYYKFETYGIASKLGLLPHHPVIEERQSWFGRWLSKLRF